MECEWDLFYIIPLGDFSYEQGSAGWTDMSIGNQGWELKSENNSASTGEC